MSITLASSTIIVGKERWSLNLELETYIAPRDLSSNTLSADPYKSRKSVDLSSIVLSLVKEAAKISSPFPSHICSSSVMLFRGI